MRGTSRAKTKRPPVKSKQVKRRVRATTNVEYERSEADHTEPSTRTAEITERKRGGPQGTDDSSECYEASDGREAEERELRRQSRQRRTTRDQRRGRRKRRRRSGWRRSTRNSQLEDDSKEADQSEPATPTAAKKTKQRH
jgi:hypothetical protein